MIENWNLMSIKNTKIKLFSATWTLEFFDFMFLIDGVSFLDKFWFWIVFHE
jgi:hypothetical protein